MVFIFEVVVILLFVSFATSQVIWPWVIEEPLFPLLRPSVRRARRVEAALRAVQRELADYGRNDPHV